jgi:hypothetical protein
VSDAFIVTSFRSPIYIERRTIFVPKSNKELAVELYEALIQARATVAAAASNTNVRIPSTDEVIEEIAELAERLAQIKD